MEDLIKSFLSNTLDKDDIDRIKKLNYTETRRLAFEILGNKCSDGRYCSSVASTDVDLFNLDHTKRDTSFRKKYFNGNRNPGTGIPMGERTKELKQFILDGTLKEKMQ